MEELVSALVAQSQAYTDNMLVLLVCAVVCVGAIVWATRDIKKDERERDAVWADRIATAFRIHDSNK